MPSPSAGDDLAYTGVVTAIVGTFLRPWFRAIRRRRHQRRIADAWFHGTPGVKGISDTVLSAPERLVNLETELRALTAKTDVMFQVIMRIDRKVSPTTGADTNELGDVVRRMAKDQGVWTEGLEEG